MLGEGYEMNYFFTGLPAIHASHALHSFLALHIDVLIAAVFILGQPPLPESQT